jgi:hypothetical protein
VQPFTEDELSQIWEVLPAYPDEYRLLGSEIAKQTEALSVL